MAEEPFLEEERLRGWEVTQEGEGVFVLSGHSMDSLLDAVNFEELESMRWFHRTLRASGVIDRLRELGAEEGDTVRLGDMEFEFVE
jgi:GTP-binding protein